VDFRVAAEEISSLADQLRRQDVFGRSEVMRRLFDYLADASAAGLKPKEFEVAAAVFGRDARFDGAQDASVRVAVHRLRKRLEAHYAGPGKDETSRLAIPRGEYRFVVAAKEAPGDTGTPPRRRRGPFLALAALLLVLNGAAWAAWWATHDGGREAAVRRQAPWAGLIGDSRPLLVVMGDYYIFADLDEPTGSGRLIREYDINSPEELDDWLMDHPDKMGRYQDLDLFYLPVGAADALREVMPVLAAKAKAPDRVRVVMASDLTPEMLTRNDVLYVGYLSGLRMLRDPVFAASRFRVGETYDELIDTRTGRRYQSQEGGPDQSQASQRDLGYVAALPGPSGNRIVILAGARDMGLMQTAEALTDPAALRALAKAVKGATAFEALYDVDGMRRANFGGRLLVGAPLDAGRAWSPPRKPLRFPAG
jgi:hypothetical protein